MKTVYSNKDIWKIAYPCLISLVMEQLIGMTDTAFLGRVGEVELGASAIAGVYYLAIFMVGFGFSIGAQIIIARRNGERNYKDIGNVFYHGKYQEGIPADSLVVYPQHSAGNDALGTLQEHTYEGTLPAASCPGIRYHLTIRNKEHSGDGTFALTLTYLEAENGEDRTFSYTGKRYTQRGTPDDNDATVWQMIADNEQDIFNFLVESDSTLVLLNDRFERNKSDLNYSLVRVK